MSDELAETGTARDASDGVAVLESGASAAETFGIPLAVLAELHAPRLFVRGGPSSSAGFAVARVAHCGFLTAAAHCRPDPW